MIPRLRNTRVGQAPDRRIVAQAICVLFCAAVCLDGAGCVRRRMTIRSNPPGAVVRVDNYEIGRTPCSVDFTYYGTRTIKLEAPGYETLTVEQPFLMPWYEFPPLDFITENLVSAEIRDERSLSFQLMPQVIVPTEALLERAENLRRGSRIEGYEAVVHSEAIQPATQPLPPLVPENLPPGQGTPSIETLPPGGRPVFPRR